MATAEANKANPVYGLGRSVATKHLLLNGKPCVDAEKLFRLAAGLERPSSLDAISSALRAKSLEKAAQARRRNVTTKEEVGKAVDVAANVTGGILQIGCAAFFLIIIAAWGVRLIMGRDLQLLGWFLVGGVILAIALLLKKSGVFDALSSGTDLTNIVREQVLAFGEARDRIQQEIAQRLRTELGSVVQQQIALQKKISVNRANPDPGAKLLAEQDEVALSLLRHQTSSAAEAVDYGARDGYEEFAEAVMPLYYAAISAAGRRKEVIRGSEPGYKDTQDEVERIEAEITTMRLIQTSGANDAEIERLRARQDEIRRRADSRLRPSGTPQASRQLDAWLRELDGLERAILDHCGFTSDAKESAIVRWRTLGDKIARDRTPKGTGAPTTVAEKTASMQVNPFYALVLLAAVVVGFGIYRSMGSKREERRASDQRIAEANRREEEGKRAKERGDRIAKAESMPTPLPAAGGPPRMDDAVRQKHLGILPPVARFTYPDGSFERMPDGTWKNVHHGKDSVATYYGWDDSYVYLTMVTSHATIWLPLAGGRAWSSSAPQSRPTPLDFEVVAGAPAADVAAPGQASSAPTAEATAATPDVPAATVVPTEVAQAVPTSVPVVPTPAGEPGSVTFTVRADRPFDTGLRVAKGSTIIISATGSVCLGKKCFDADGDPSKPVYHSCARNGLSGAIMTKDSRKIFCVGRNYRGRAPADGQLRLFANCESAFLATGSFVVKVKVE